MGITIFADAASNLFKEILLEENADIRVMSLHLYLGDKEYKYYEDIKDIKAFSKEYYEAIAKGEEARTSLVSPGDYQQAFNEEIAKGNKVICFTMASGISGTYNSACLVRDMVNEENKEKVVEVIDSMTAGLGEGLEALYAYRLVQEGKTFEEIVKEIEEFKHFVRSDFIVDKITYLLKTGRVGKALARFANLLNVKVQLKRGSESKINFAGSCIGKKLAIKKLAKTVIDNINLAIKQMVYVTHCNCLEEAEELKSHLVSGGIKDVKIYDYDLISGSHIGPGSLAVFYVANEAY